MGKYYIKPCDPEHYDYQVYYSEGDAKEDGLYARGDGWEVNKELRKDVVDSIDSFLDTLDREDEDVIENVRYFFAKKNGQKLTYPEIRKIVELTEDFYNLKEDEEDEVIANILSILNGEEYAVGGQVGYSQGDYVDMIYPKSKEKIANYMGHVFLATGTEFMITENKYDAIPDFSEEDHYTDFCPDDYWRTEEVRKWAADMIGCKPEEIIVLKEDGTVQE